MLIIILLFVLFLLLSRSCGWNGALSAFAALFALPIVAYPLIRFQLTPFSAYFISIFVLIFSIWFVSGRRLRKLSLQDFQDELPAFALFFLTLIASQLFCLLWPDFISIGERLRDYAILAATIDNPGVANEPWMSGAVLNYYVYWYRFGAMVSNLGGLPVWETYHFLAAFCFASYCTLTFLCARLVAKFSIIGSLTSATIIAAGSNFDGILTAYEHDANWWRPSRVILGAINEFPAWSFILGDLHPHFTNLIFFPFAVCVICTVLSSSNKNSFFLGSLISALLFPLFIYNANAWELPVWLGFVLTSIVTALTVCEFASVKNYLRSSRPNINKISINCVFSCLIILLLCYSLWMSSRNIAPAHDPLTLVRAPIASSRFSELFSHWGVPLTIFSIFLPCLLNGWRMRTLGYVALILSALVDSGSTFLMCLFILNAIRILEQLQLNRSINQIILNALSLASIGLILIPEIVFFNDPYGGENERMNTIFKIYAANWFPIHLSAFVIARDSWNNFKNEKIQELAAWAAQACILVTMLLFFRHAAAIRMQKDFSIEPKSEGLSSINREFPGAAATIQFLERLPRTVVLEGQGNPYSYTTHISTLAGQTAFLGWANHVGLLTRNNAEVQRREQVSEQIYTLDDCNQRKELIAKEGIKYLVVGPLEQQKYPGASGKDYSCLKLENEAEQYRVFSN